MDDYKKIVKRIDEIIETYGIKKYVEKWKKEKPQFPKNITNYQEFIEEANQYVNAYHKHTSIFSKQLLKDKELKYSKEIKNETNDRKMPKLTWNKRDKIGKIEIFHFYDYGDQLSYKDSQKMIRRLENKIAKWINKGMEGLIIDLRNHYGGNMWPTVKGLNQILGNTTLFGAEFSLSEDKDNKWVNLINNDALWNQPFITKELSFKKRISVIISEKTASSGEIIAAIFKGRLNCKIFGYQTNKTAGFFSINDVIKINDDLDIYMTIGLIITIDGKIHDDEYLHVDNKTKNPIKESIKWIIFGNHQL